MKFECASTNCAQLSVHWNKFRMRLKNFADSKIFMRGIFIAILTNTLSLSIEHYNQPYELTLTIEICNCIFILIFFIEIIIRIIADGGLNFIKSPYNVLDGAIVILR